MPLYTETVTGPKMESSFLQTLVEPNWSVDTDVLLAGSGSARSVVAGQVLARVTASGKLVALDPAANTGAQTPVGVARSDATAPDGADGEVVLIARGATLIAGGLIWPAGITDNQRNAAIATLKSLGLVVRV